MARIERATSPLPRECSTTEPHGLISRLNLSLKRARPAGVPSSCRTGAGDGNRTRVISLEGWGSTIELLPLGALAGRSPSPVNASELSWWRRLDSNQRRRKPTDLQSAPFSHSGTPPRRTRDCSTPERLLADPPPIDEVGRGAEMVALGHERAVEVVRRVTRRQHLRRRVFGLRARPRRPRLRPQTEHGRRRTAAQVIDYLASKRLPTTVEMAAGATDLDRHHRIEQSTPWRAQASSASSPARRIRARLGQQLEHPRQRARLAAPGRKRQPVGVAGGRIRILADDRRP